MTKATELSIRARAVVKYPGWRVDIVGPTTAVLTSIMGRQRVIEVRQRRKRRKASVVRIAKWLLRWIRSISKQTVDAIEWVVVSIIWLFGLWMVCIGIVVLALL